MDPERYQQLMDLFDALAGLPRAGGPAALAILLVAGCGRRATDPPQSPPSPATASPQAVDPAAPPARSARAGLRLVLDAERNFPPGIELDGTILGGISALLLRPDRTLLALSDGRGEHGPNRLFEFDADTLEPRRARLLGGIFATAELDTEGMAAGWGDEIWIATEGDGNRSPRLPPTIWRIDAEWRSLRQVPLPKAFLPTPSGPLTVGVRHNLGIEALTGSPPQAGPHRVVAAVEQALAQDGPPASFDRGTLVRLVVYDDPERPTAQHVYLTEPVPPPDEPGPVTEAEMGVSALAAYSRERLWVMERSAVAVEGRFTNQVRIYEVNLHGAVDVSSHDAVTSSDAVDKRLVLDLDDIVGQLDPRYGRLDNFEAMALAPGPDGALRLYVASDDNFSDDQRTALLIFRVEGS